MNIIKVLLHNKQRHAGKHEGYYITIIIKETSINGYHPNDAKSAETTELFYGSNDEEYVRVIKAKDFIDSVDNKIEISTHYKINDIIEKSQTLTNINDLPFDIKECLYSDSHNRNSRTNIHREIPFIINYCFERKRFNILARHFICGGNNWTQCYDIWLVQKSELTWQLVQVSMRPKVGDVVYDGIDLSIRNFEDQSEIANICKDARFAASQRMTWPETFGSRNVAFSSEKSYKPNRHDDASALEKMEHRIKLCKWVSKICVEQINVKLPGIIYSCINKHYSDSLIKVIMGYLIVPAENGEDEKDFKNMKQFISKFIKDDNFRRRYWSENYDDIIKNDEEFSKEYRFAYNGKRFETQGLWLWQRRLTEKQKLEWKNKDNDIAEVKQPAQPPRNAMLYFVHSYTNNEKVRTKYWLPEHASHILDDEGYGERYAKALLKSAEAQYQLQARWLWTHIFTKIEKAEWRTAAELVKSISKKMDQLERDGDED